MMAAYESIVIQAIYAWDNLRRDFVVASWETVQQLKLILARHDDVPARLVRIIHQGRALLDDDKLLSETTLVASPGPIEVAVLYPMRDEHGDVAVWNDKCVLTLRQGEWSMQTAIHEVIKRLEDLQVPLQGRSIVYNGLTLEEATNFGQNEIRSGSVLHIV
jgi:hypothetical protein